MSKPLIIFALLLSSIVGFSQAAPTPNDGGRDGGREGRNSRRGNWDPAAMKEMMLTRTQESLEISDDDWAIIGPRFSAVYEASIAERSLSSRGFGRRGGGEPAPEVAAVEKAIEGGDATTIKTALDALRKAREAKAAELTKAKASLKEVLSVSQEARLVLSGMLD